MLKIHIFIVLAVFLFSLSLQAEEYDYGDNFAEAHSFVMEKDINGTLDTYFDEDWFKLQVETLDELYFEFEVSEGSIIYDDKIALQFYDSNMTEKGYLLLDYYDESKWARIYFPPDTYYMRVYVANGYPSNIQYRIFSHSIYGNKSNWVPDQLTIDYCKIQSHKCGINMRTVIIPL